MIQNCLDVTVTTQKVQSASSHPCILFIAVTQTKNDVAGDTRIQESNCAEADINQRRRSCVMLNDHKTVAN